MTLTAQQLRIASRIDARMQTLLRTGQDDMAIFAAMADHMPKLGSPHDPTRWTS